MFVSRLRLECLTLLAFIVIFLWGAEPSRGIQNPLLDSSDDAKAPMTIQADAMTFWDRANRVVFEGHVVVVRGEMTMKADQLDIRLSDKGTDGSHSEPRPAFSLSGREISWMTAKGNVDVRRGTQRAKAGQAVYRKDSSVIELSDKPEAWQGDTHLTGTRITLWLDQNRSAVDNGTVVFQATATMTKDRTGDHKPVKAPVPKGGGFLEEGR